MDIDQAFELILEHYNEQYKNEKLKPISSMNALQVMNLTISVFTPEKEMIGMG